MPSLNYAEGVRYLGRLRRKAFVISGGYAEGVRQFQPSGWSAATTLGTY